MITKTATAATLLLFSATAPTPFRAQGDCPRAIGDVSFAGASTLERLTKAWATSWGCPSVNVAIESGGSSEGIATVCGTSSQSKTNSADIAGVTRLPFRSEAGSDDGYNYNCERSPRNLIGIEVAVEGVSLAVPQMTTTKDGTLEVSAALSCLKDIEGLSLPQLRWIFSSFSDDELVADGWDQDSIPYSDGDPTTHLWSELSPTCEDVEIVIAGPPVDSEAALLFKELVFGEKSFETFDVNRPGSYFASKDNDELADFMVNNGTSAIAYFDIGYILTSLDLGAFSMVNIFVEGEMFKPGAKALEYGSYPLSRVLYYFLLNDEKSLEVTRPFIDFIFTDDGDAVTKRSGFWPLADSKKLLMATRIQSKIGIPKAVVESYCGPPGASISIAGSSTLHPIADLWSQLYSTFCDVTISVEGGGSGNGASRVCGDESKGTPVEIGDMSREWKESEATEQNGYLYECIIGDTSRSAIQVDVGIDGLTVAVAHNGVASECINILGGLTTDQLRWIFSTYDENELVASGWDPSSVPNSDGNSETHLWNELHEDCSKAEIRIAGPDDISGTYDYFLETIFLDHDNGETYDINRPFSYVSNEDDEVLVDYIFTYPAAIAFFGYSYYFENQASLESVAIQNSDGVYLKPTVATVSDGSYNPLARRIYMNLLNSEADLKNTVPLVRFGLENPDIMSVTGFVAIPNNQADELIKLRLGNTALSNGEQTSGMSTGAIVGITIGCLMGLCLVIGTVYKCTRRGDSQKVEVQEKAR
ncbi:phosphate binding protein [Nitzschia inconspicua]|uniref:Phosphate binding protein n=1 Tax=Nitzschia inconspicua TaxID=303405 RepID=A0A9K3LBU3_9STRA|nr:phosphate binding protein [Nitzschia inconspicua]